MTSAALSLLCRVIRRRLSRGERLETVLADYTKLTDAEQEQVKKLLKK